MKKSTLNTILAAFVCLACSIFVYFYKLDIILVCIMIIYSLIIHELSYSAGFQFIKERYEEPMLKLSKNCDYLEKEIKDLILELKNSKSGHSENDILAKRLKKVLKNMKA